MKFASLKKRFIFASDYSLLMTEKQEKILHTALDLFAREGYAATATSKVAKAAGVSEGLIFRHFGNKEGLLQAILTQGNERAKSAYAEVVMEPDAKERIRKALSLPFAIKESDYAIWRLIYALKWQTDSYDDQSLSGLKLVLKDAFEQLGYTDSTAETELLFMILDGAATALLLHKPSNPQGIVQALLTKYQL
jgi:AcrR family transcriptional regulator